MRSSGLQVLELEMRLPVLLRSYRVRTRNSLGHLVLELYNLQHQIKDEDEGCGVPENHENASDKDEQMKELSGELKPGISTAA